MKQKKRHEEKGNENNVVLKSETQPLDLGDAARELYCYKEFYLVFSCAPSLLTWKEKEKLDWTSKKGNENNVWNLKRMVVTFLVI